MSTPLRLPASFAVGQPKSALLGFVGQLYIYRLPPSFSTQLILGMCLVSVITLLSLLGLYQVYRDGTFWLLRTRGRFLVSNPTTGFLLGFTAFQLCFLGFLTEQLRVYHQGQLPTQMGYWFSGIWFPLWGAAYFAVAGSYFMQPDVCEYTPPYRASWLRRKLSRPVITNTIHIATPIAVFVAGMAMMARTGSSYQGAVYAWQIWSAVVQTEGGGAITERHRQGALDVWRDAVKAWESANIFFTFALVLCVATVAVYAPVAFQVCRAIRRRIDEMRYPTVSNMANVLAVPLWGESSDAPAERPLNTFRMVEPIAGHYPPSDRVTASPSTFTGQDGYGSTEERLRMLKTAWRHVVFQAVTVHAGVILIAAVALICRLKATEWVSQGPEALAKSWTVMVLAIMYGIIVAGFIALLTVFRRIRDFSRRRLGSAFSGEVPADPSKGVVFPSPLSRDATLSVRKRWSHMTRGGQTTRDEGAGGTDTLPTRPKPTRLPTFRSRRALSNATPESSDTWLAGLSRLSSRFSSLERPSSEREIIDLEVGPHEVLASIRPSPRPRTGGGLYEGIELPPETLREFEDDEESLSNLFGPRGERGSDGPERQQTRDTLFVFGFSQKGGGGPGGGGERRPSTASSVAAGRESQSVGSLSQLQEFLWIVTPPSVNYEAPGEDASMRSAASGRAAAERASGPGVETLVRP